MTKANVAIFNGRIIKIKIMGDLGPKIVSECKIGKSARTYQKHKDD
jgi:hypothetical protein